MQGWDILYREYAAGGEASGAVGRNLRPAFRRFVDRTQFPKRSALDIGCGFGQYLTYLEARGFAVAGVDISEIAVAEARQAVKDGSRIMAGDMHEYPFPEGGFDLVISFETMQHGTHEQIREMGRKIYRSLVPGGSIFIELSRANQWATFRKSRKTAPHTVVPLEGPETGIPHSFFSKEEAKEVFREFEELEVRRDSWFGNNWLITGKKA